MCRPSSALRMAEGAGGVLCTWSCAAAGVRGWDEGEDQRGAQFRDCARMVHKMVNILDKMPKGAQPKAKAALHEIYGAETKVEAEKAFELFVKTYQAKYPKATECLKKDKGVLLAFDDFPAEHWVHIRTTNPIESVVPVHRCSPTVAGYV